MAKRMTVWSRSMAASAESQTRCRQHALAACSSQTTGPGSAGAAGDEERGSRSSSPSTRRPMGLGAQTGTLQGSQN